MKKLLLALLAAGTITGVQAKVETSIIQDVIVGLSTDGHYASSEYYGSIVVYDLDTDEHYDYMESNSNTYGVGSGNFWSKNSMVGYIDMAGGSAVWRGRWSKLPIAAADPAGMGNANGITPDGSRICGNASTGVGLVLDDAKLMVYPCYWDKNTNGTYGKQNPLPYPTTDFIGDVPQYVTAISISTDGKTIWGQITSGNGFFHEPIVYKQNPETEEWTYETPMRSQMMPEGIKFVPYPGDGPVMPSMESFMTEEELDAYDEAYQKYLADPTSMPEPTYPQFMTQEEIDAYNAALEPYNEWVEKFLAYSEMLEELREKALSFVMNVTYISPNGRYVAMDVEKVAYDAEGHTQSIYTPYLYDMESGEGKVVGLEGYKMSVTSVNDNGDMLAFMDADAADLGYVYRHNTGEWITYVDYLIEREPSLSDWIKSNWSHEVEVELDPETGATDFLELEISGRPFVSADWTAFSSFAYNFWGGDSKGQYLSYVIRFEDEESAIEEIDGQKNDAQPAFYDLQGHKVSNPSHGIFIKRLGDKAEKIAL